LMREGNDRGALSGAARKGQNRLTILSEDQGI
jgi:hypothetical protein